MSSPNNLIVFVTVGSTRFDDLVDKVLSEEFGRKLATTSFGRLVVQTGNSPIKTNLDNKENINDGDTRQFSLYGLAVEIWKFKQDLRESFVQADLVICHAGSGTLIEALRLQKRVIAIPNETLLHNHQAELAEALEKEGHLVSSTVKDLADAIDIAMTKSFTPFPEYDGSKLQTILDKEMGFL